MDIIIVMHYYFNLYMSVIFVCWKDYFHFQKFRYIRNIPDIMFKYLLIGPLVKSNTMKRNYGHKSLAGSVTRVWTEKGNYS